jgi:hypothetical protein
MDQLLTVEQAAEQTGKSISHIRRLCRDGVIDCQKVGSGQHAVYLIHPGALAAWAAIERHSGRPRREFGEPERIQRDKAGQQGLLQPYEFPPASKYQKGERVLVNYNNEKKQGTVTKVLSEISPDEGSMPIRRYFYSVALDEGVETLFEEDRIISRIENSPASSNTF